MDLEVQPEADSTTVGNVKGGCSRFVGSHSGSPGPILPLWVCITLEKGPRLWSSKVDDSQSSLRDLFPWNQ